MSINQTRLRPLSALKRRLLTGSGRSPRTCPIGLYRGLTLNLDLESDAQLWLGLWERETHPHIRRAARRCRWAVDVGAGHGELCVYLLARSGAEIVFAIEPQEAARDVLETNLALGGYAPGARVRIVNRPVGASSNGTFLALDSLELDRSQPGFLKIDVDGPECEVLDGAARLLTEADVDVLVETHSRDLERGCIERLDSLGYACQVIRNAWWRVLVPEQRPIDHNRWLRATKHGNSSTR